MEPRTYAVFSLDFIRRISPKVVEFIMRTRAGSVAERARRLRFRRIVEQAVAELPVELRSQLENLAIVVEDEPTAEQCESSGDEELFGIYEGIPLIHRGSDNSMSLPDRIVIFRGPLERAFIEPREIAEQVRITVYHELAHHVGFEEDEIEDLGLA